MNTEQKDMLVSLLGEAGWQYDFGNCYFFCMWHGNVIGIWQHQFNYFIFRYSMWVTLSDAINKHPTVSNTISGYLSEQVMATWLDNWQFDKICEHSHLLTVTNK